MKYLSPFLFGTIGGDILLNQLDPVDSLFGLLMITAGQLGRIFVTAFCMKVDKKLSVKERLFMGFAYIPKAALQASFSNEIFTLGVEKQIPGFIKYGKNVFDVGIFSIILCAPVGSMVTNMIGETWLKRQDKRSFNIKNIL